MKKTIAAILAGALCLTALTACGGSKTDSSAADSSAAAGDDKTITVGATPTPHAEILNAAKDALKAEGYTLNVVEFTDYVQPNTALVDGDLDANYFQHMPYLNNFNKENNADLVSAIEMHYEPFGIYAGKTASIEELKDGAAIAIPNDGSNETRALLLLQDAGLIKLKDSAEFNPTIDDIETYNTKITIEELKANVIPSTLADVTAAVVNGNYALDFGLKTEDAIYKDDQLDIEEYWNLIAARSADLEDADKLETYKKVVAAFQSDETEKVFNDQFGGYFIKAGWDQDLLADK